MFLLQDKISMKLCILMNVLTYVHVLYVCVCVCVRTPSGEGDLTKNGNMGNGMLMIKIVGS